jgi:hypothetical protein
MPTGELKHGIQMEMWVLTRVPMKDRHYRTSYDVKKKVANVATGRF